ncbi:MAG: hypothetical protein ACOVP4_06310 [Bacteriovoracaceae bacterium]
MKYLCLILILGVFTLTTFAQKKYVDPNERQKRGLMEEGDKSSPTSVVSEAKSEPAPEVKAVEMTPQQSLCECSKLQSLNDQLINLWWSSDEVTKAMTSKKEIDGRRDNIKQTMIYLVSSHRDDKSPVDPDKCTETEVAEKNMKKLKKMIAIQEKNCDVYKLRGIEND